jgi:hypothetical protein
MARRESTKHGPRLDDQLKDETRPLEQGAHVEARVEEERTKEGPADAESLPEIDGETALPRDPVLARRELSRHLRLGVFPAGRAELLVEAEQNDAPEAVLGLLRRLPANARFETVYEVWDALGGEMEPAAAETLHERGKHHRGGDA